jgi:hypothetical protein
MPDHQVIDWSIAELGKKHEQVILSPGSPTPSWTPNVVEKKLYITGGSGAQWVQYDLEKPAQISAIGIYWAEDPRGRVKLPESFRVLVKQGGEWQPVAAETPKPKADAMNRIRFAPVETSSVRLEVSSPHSFTRLYP